MSKYSGQVDLERLEKISGGSDLEPRTTPTVVIASPEATLISATISAITKTIAEQSKRASCYPGQCG
ncbi:hypothetical protein OPL79_002580 [Enterococcus faecalis]|uniref:hypothetical protein n=1 Tax=Enterococcus faecalis TaxID=1351 RepID=UPI001572F64D|nr:hypothetical protein [Enterococcus faecalis]EIQ7138672.1 hypothetical protein [Enterococcus faecalis]EJF8945980.1 hypothetical protein [Enterococcus faecalis]EKB7628924.1 hypothetical protein [Enterococcus faecalis]NSQ65158.1 hypothetical protein [Enterococcus faecalis]